MIQQLYTYQQSSTLRLLQLLINSFKKYNSNELDATASLQATLDTCIAAYVKNGKADKVSRFESLKAELITALRGVNPYTLEKVQLRRNEMIKNTAFKILQNAEDIIRLDLQEINEKIQQAQDLISQILLAALQSGLILLIDLQNLKTHATIEELWKQIGNDPNFTIAHKKVKLLVSGTDVVIFIDQIISALK